MRPTGVFCVVWTLASIATTTSVDAEELQRINAATSVPKVSTVPRVLDANSHLPNCANVTLTRDYWEISSSGDLSLKIGYRTDPFPVGPFSVLDGDLTVCFPLSPQLLRCKTAAMRAGTYAVRNHTLYRDGKPVAQLGDYYIDDGGDAWWCNVTIRTSRTTPRCHKLRLNAGQYQVRNGSVYVAAIATWIERPLYVAVADDAIDLCYPLSIDLLNCKTSNVQNATPLYYELTADYKLYYLSSVDVHGLGEYYFNSDQADVVFCGRDDFLDISNALTVVYKVTYSLSTVCLILAFVYQLILPRVNTHSKCLLSHILSLIVFNSCIVHSKYDAVTRQHPRATCYAMFFVAYFTGMAAFLWLNVSSFDVCRSFSKSQLLAKQSVPARDRKNCRFLYYSLYVWGSSAALSTLVLLIDSFSKLESLMKIHPHITSMCWFHDKTSILVFYYGPLLALVCVNSVLFGVTVHRIRHISRGTKIVNRKRKQQMLGVCVKLFVVMGIGWTVEGVMWSLVNVISFPFWYLQDAIMSMQGMAILVIVAWRKDNRQLLKNLRQRALFSWGRCIK